MLPLFFWNLVGSEQFLNFSYKGKLGAGIAIIIIYTFMTGFPPSILRALIMLIIILIGKLIFKTADNFTLIFLQVLLCSYLTRNY